VPDDILATVGLCRHFGGVQAVNYFTFSVPTGQLRAIIGPNGAGKTTLFNLVSGQLPCHSGHIYFKGKEITGRPPSYLCRHGLGRTFQVNSIFLNFTVLENVQLAYMVQQGKTWNLWSPARKVLVEESEVILDMVGLADQAGKLGSALSYGDRRRLEIALTLACKPDLLLLDEPTCGMSLSEKPQLVKLIQNIVREKGITAVLIEHDMDVVFSVADRITVMHRGAIIAEGSLREIQANSKVQEVYLGEDRCAPA
jgi:branched-chain amino acid transport system ATP-binding protein